MSNVLQPSKPTPCVEGNARRLRMLMISFCFDPHGSMEERNGWQRAILASRSFDVTVLYSTRVPLQTLLDSLPPDLPENALQFVHVEDDWYSGLLARVESGFYFSYRQWHRLAYRNAKKMHAQVPFDIAHQATLCGFREPGYVWKLGIPFLWGPIGGSHNFPMQFKYCLDWTNRIREGLRSVINYYQLHLCRKIRQAMRASTAVIAATQQASRDFKLGFGIDAAVELETGIDHSIDPLRHEMRKDRPLRLLWAGRLRAWKALPLLLHAIAELPQDVSVELRVVGDGSCDKAWRDLADKLGIANRITWKPWTTYRETLLEYRWADAFVFTSLRDTSGTGLLESLAAGCPIIGVNHQGAADIMTDECAIRIPVLDWQSVVAGFREGITSLARDSQLWLSLSHGATRRASDFEWKTRRGSVDDAYQMAIQQIRTHIQVARR